MGEIKLAAFRVKAEGQPPGFKSLEMTREERAARRAFVRGLLKGTRWEHLKNEQLDQIRMIQCGDTWIIEDAEMYHYTLRG